MHNLARWAPMLAVFIKLPLCGCSSVASPSPPGVTEPDDAGSTEGSSPPLEAGSADAGPPGAKSWAKRYGGPTFDQGFRIASDSAGRLTLAGKLGSGVDFGGGVLPSAGGGDGFVVSLEADGAHRWSKSFGGSEPDHLDAVNGVAVAPNGRVLVTGGFSLTMELAGVVHESAGGDDGFVAALDPEGGALWSKSFGSEGEELFRDLAVANDGSVWITGAIGGPVDFGGGALDPPSLVSAFVAKLAPDGAHVFSRSFGSKVVCLATGVAVNEAGAGFLVGHFDGTADFGGGALTSAGLDDAFVTALDPEGAELWSARIGGPGADGAYAVAPMSGGGVVVAGKFQETVEIGGQKLTSAGSNDVLLVVLSKSGAPVWARGFGGAAADRAWTVAADPSSVVVGGYVTGAVDFGGGVLGQPEVVNAFVARYSNAGEYLDARVFQVSAKLPSGGLGSVSLALGVFGVALAPNGAANLTGAFRDTTDAFGAALVSSGDSDVFVARWEPSP